eukprot:COSAG02_NODE_5948_length_3919_cov_14.379581_4_plen_190_part_00
MSYIGDLAELRSTARCCAALFIAWWPRPPELHAVSGSDTRETRRSEKTVPHWRKTTAETAGRIYPPRAQQGGAPQRHHPVFCGSFHQSLGMFCRASHFPSQKTCIFGRCSFGMTQFFTFGNETVPESQLVHYTVSYSNLHHSILQSTTQALHGGPDYGGPDSWLSTARFGALGVYSTFFTSLVKNYYDS